MDIKTINFIEFFEKNCMPELLNISLYGGHLDEMDKILGRNDTYGAVTTGNFRHAREKGWKEHSEFYIKKFLRYYGIYKDEYEKNIEYVQMKMNQENKKKLTNMNDREIMFMEFFERVMLPNRRKITLDMVQEGERISGVRVMTPGCTTCLHGAAVDLMNLYNRNLPAWIEYKKRKKEAGLVDNVTQYTQNTFENFAEPIKVVDKEPLEEYDTPDEPKEFIPINKRKKINMYEPKKKK